ncbi:hypothetical protein B5M47_01415 [candidate division CPR3 bacterium 4484_211]|uniref:G5 domain-containing protein n=1 Tax=candidate division CPR3 bacterium 4484_211 TaxID=1968527 RepID=A0A1W9NYH1_UNCC3|nr:MAG: hypothetical protein B5M47_01415 [candidate division CPR3 bacterium 4484_211]
MQKLIKFISLLSLAGGAVVNGQLSNSLAKMDNFPQYVEPGFFAYHNIPVTRSVFSQEKQLEEEVIPFGISYEDSDRLEWGKRQLKQKGVNGLIRRTYLISLWRGEVYDKQLMEKEVTPPVPEIVLRGTKKVLRKLTVPEGSFSYFAQKKLFATSYDGRCLGCSGLTYLGTPVRHGVCAVDPKVIPLGSLLYVEGYGLCRAEDIGGAVKGNRIDLGFEDVRTGFWSAGWTKVYLLVD